MIGSNLTAQIQISRTTENAIGENVKSWETVQTLRGFLDLQSGKSEYMPFSAKIQECTHIFICDYTPLASGVTAENSRMIISGKSYDIMLIDNPMQLCRHLEIYLKFTGGQ